MRPGRRCTASIRLAEAEEIIAEIKTLKAEWDALAGKPED